MIKSNLSKCEGCVFCKHSKSAFAIEPVTSATKVLALIHSHICELMSTPSLKGTLYCLLFIDDYSHYTHVYFLWKKAKTFSCFESYKILFEKQTLKYILILHLDNGGKFISKKFNKFCEDNNIWHYFTNSYNPFKNDSSNKKNRTLMEVAQSNLKVVNLSCPS